MQQWLFVSSSGQQFTAHETDVPALVHSSQITPQTLMWRDGMAQWMPAASVFPALFTAAASVVTQPMVAGRPAAALPGDGAAGAGTAGRPGAVIAQPEPAAVRRLAAPLFQRKGWIKFLGVTLIIGGVFSFPIGLILIFAGLALMKLAGSVERAQASGDPAALEQAHREAAKYFYLHGIFMLVSMLLMALVLAVLAFGFGAALMSGFKGGESGAFGDPGGPQTIEDMRFPDSVPPDSTR